MNFLAQSATGNILEDIFGSEWERLVNNVELATLTIAFTIVLSLTVWKFLFKKQENISVNAIIMTVLIVLGIAGYPVFLKAMSQLGESFFEMLNDGEENPIITFYDNVRDTANERVEDSNSSFWSILLGFSDAETSFLTSLQIWVFELVSYVNDWLLKVAASIQKFIMSFLGFVAPIVIAIGLIPIFQGKIPRFIIAGAQIALWPFGWAIGAFMAKFLVLPAALTPDAVQALTASNIMSISIILILWTILYLILTPIVIKQLIGGQGGGMLGKAITAFAIASRFMGPKGQVAAQAAETVNNATSSPSTRGSKGSSALALTTSNSGYTRKNGIIVPSSTSIVPRSSTAVGPSRRPAVPRLATKNKYHPQVIDV